MNRYDDDDLEDYANSDYSDDQPTPEEEEQIEQLLPIVKQELKGLSGISDDVIRESIWANYMEVEAIVKELKKKYEKTQKKEVKKEEVIQPTFQPESTKPMSKIAALAKSRALQRTQSQQQKDEVSSKTSVSILDKLKSGKSNGTGATTTPKPALSSLASLRSKNGLSGLKGLNTPSLKRPNPFEKKKSIPQPPSTQTQESSIEKADTMSDEPEVPPKQQEPLIKIYDITFQESPFNVRPPHQLFQTSSLETTQKRRRLLNHGLTKIFLPANKITQVKQNFNKASPDDTVKAAASNAQATAQKEVKPITEKLQALQITPKPINNAQFDKDFEGRASSKPSTSLVIIGHVDAGKSTLTGRLLLDHQVISTQQYQRLKREATKQNKASFSLAWLMDSSPEERERGVTIESCASVFETDKNVFNIIDSPGHRDFIPNMISGVSSTDVALLVVDASTDAFESGFTLDGQTKEHTILVKSLGVEKLIVVINKMDNVDWSSDRFEEIKGQLDVFFKNVGFKINENVEYVPVSAFSGLNVSKKPESEEDKRKLEWYKGDSVIDALEKVASTKAQKDTKGPFICSINDVSVSSSGLEITGRIHSGSISIHQQIIISPSNQTTAIDSIILNEKKVNVAIAGDFFTIKTKSIETPTEVQKGDLISIEPLPIAHKLTLRLMLFDTKRPILQGTPLVLFRGDSQLVASITKIIAILDKVTGEPLPKKAPRHLKASQVARVEVEVGARGLPGMLFKDDKVLGRIVLRKDGETVGAGVVENFEE